jgi:dihydroflavonol-4-reductase
MILVTGATGFLGAEVARQLAGQGNRIRCIKRKSSVIPEILKLYADVIEWVAADITDLYALEDALEGVTQVYNCAAWVSLKQADKEPMIRTNVTGTANVVDLCVLHSTRLLHVSSVAAVGDAKPGEMTTENHHLDASADNDGYAISKLESEMEVWRGIAEGLDAVIVNPSIILGPGAGELGSGALFTTVRNGLKFYTRGSMGFVDVEDVAACMIKLMNSDETAQRFIINAENMRFKQLFELIAKGLGVKAPTMEAKPWMMEVAWRAAALGSIFTRKAPAIDKVSAQSASIERRFDTSKLQKAINHQFKPLEQTIAETSAALRR